jgi:cold shock protein
MVLTCRTEQEPHPPPNVEMHLEHIMAHGTVKWFNPPKGFGFIQPQDGGADVFVHILAVQQAGLNTLNDGQLVSFDLEKGRQGRTPQPGREIRSPGQRPKSNQVRICFRPRLSSCRRLHGT